MTKVESEESPATTRPTVAGFLVGDAPEWSEYVARHPAATLFHTLRWRDALRQIFRHRDHYLIARRGGRITGILPIVEVRSLLFGTSLVSVPFGVYGGLLVDDRESALELVEHARAIAEKVGARYVELRHLERPEGLDLPSIDIYYTFREAVPDSEDECLRRIPRKARAEVRKALKNERLTTQVDRCGIPELYELFSHNKRQLGSPIFPQSLFWHLKNILGDDVMILDVELDGRPIAAVMSFIHDRTVMPYYSGTAPGAERYSASNLMYYELMVWASRRGLEVFDFGRSREGTGAFAFKKHQGFEPTALSYDYILVGQDHLPALNPSNPRYRLAKSVFRNMPMWMARKLGSYLVKRAPF